jgi:RimJ/RimL family protein N-acetyltransferase
MMTDNCNPNFPPVPQRVESARLIVRPSQRQDAAVLMKWWNDPEVTSPGGNVDAMQYDERDMEDWFTRYVDQRQCATHFVICLRDEAETPIGEFYIASDDRPGCVGFAVLIGELDQWGKGYATEAVTAYAAALFASGLCQSMRMDISVGNTRAVGMCDAIGFEVEHVWANGLFQTMILTEEAFQLKNDPTIHAVQESAQD